MKVLDVQEMISDYVFVCMDTSATASVSRKNKKGMLLTSLSF